MPVMKHSFSADWVLGVPAFACVIVNDSHDKYHQSMFYLMIKCNLIM